MNQTYIPKITEKQQWYLIDARNQNLGRLSSYITNILIGKNNIMYTPYLNSKAYIIVINAKYINITGKKRSQKIYKRHSGRPGSLKTETFEQLNQRIPKRIIEHSVRGMLPKGKLGRKLFTQLKIYTENSHSHEAQKLEILSLN
uniref:Ribosomal protein L13 n=1 Tax=Leiomenia cribrosa TaxID=217483 RepID=A0A4D6WWA6_9FLOR|nr:ribosomal protein L13 [Leiomenia cribrosa]